MVWDCLGIGKNNYFSLGSADQIKSFFYPSDVFLGHPITDGIVGILSQEI